MIGAAPSAAGCGSMGTMRGSAFLEILSRRIFRWRSITILANGMIGAWTTRGAVMTTALGGGGIR